MVTTCVLSDHHGIKLEFNNNSNPRKPTNSGKLNSQLLKHPWISEEINKEIKIFLEFNEDFYFFLYFFLDPVVIQ